MILHFENQGFFPEDLPTGTDEVWLVPRYIKTDTDGEQLCLTLVVNSRDWAYWHKDRWHTTTHACPADHRAFDNLTITEK